MNHVHISRNTLIGNVSREDPFYPLLCRYQSPLDQSFPTMVTMNTPTIKTPSADLLCEIPFVTITCIKMKNPQYIRANIFKSTLFHFKTQTGLKAKLKFLEDTFQ